MTRRGSPQVVILCEDRAHYHFARKFLQLHGVTNIHQRVAPLGKGAGESWVRRQYPAEVQAQRARARYQNVGLIVMIDADRYGVRDRKDQLDAALTAWGPPLGEREADERIAVFAPKWSIETWFRFLDGVDCHEDTSYRNDYREARPTEFARRLFDRCRAGKPLGDAPPSLSDACNEWPRLEVG